MEILTILGLVLATVGVIGGLIVEGGNPLALVSAPAFMIVVVGSLGATMVATPLDDFKRAMGGLKNVFLPPKHDFKGTLVKLLELANLARREGLLALEPFTTSGNENPFLVKCLSLAIDGSSAVVFREYIEVVMDIEAENK